MRGQLFSYDLLLSAVFVIFLIMLYILTTNTLVAEMDVAELRTEMEEVAQTAADSLLRTPGDPSNWELFPITENGTRSLGLANSQSELDPEKVDRFFSITSGSAEYNATLPILGLAGRAYRYNATLEALNGTILAALNSDPPDGTAQLVVVERFARYNGTVVRFRMVVWRE